MTAARVLRIGRVEILALSDGMLEFDLCNFFPTIPGDQWSGFESYLTDEHKVRFNLGSYLIRSDGRTILVDTGLGPRPADTPDVPWGELLRDFTFANAVRLWGAGNPRFFEGTAVAQAAAAVLAS